MSEVRRWRVECGCEPDLLEDEDGGVVLYSDHAAAVARLEEDVRVADRERNDAMRCTELLRARLSALEEAARLARVALADNSQVDEAEWVFTTCTVCGHSGVAWTGPEPCVCNDCVRDALRSALEGKP